VYVFVVGVAGYSGHTHHHGTSVQMLHIYKSAPSLYICVGYINLAYIYKSISDI
jgi:hypothetical protein